MMQQARGPSASATISTNHWQGEPVSYVSKDLTGAEWSLMKTQSPGRTDVEVSLPTSRDVSRAVSSPTRRPISHARDRGRRGESACVSRLCSIRRSRISSARLFEESQPTAPDLDDAVRFFEVRVAEAPELVADELAHLIRSGTPPERIELVAQSIETWRGPASETVWGTAATSPTRVESRVRLGLANLSATTTPR